MSSMATHKAFVVQSLGIGKIVTDHPIPSPRPDHMLVKVRAVALNPTDWKHLDLKPCAGCVSGVEFAGVVEQLPERNALKQWKVGDRVAGTVHGSNESQPDDGAFQEHVVVRTGLAIKIPDDMSYENVVGLSVATISCAQGLYQQLKLPFPTDPAPKAFPVFIFGGSTTAGTLAIQYAKLSGLIVITTCSPHNFDLVRSRGADYVYDYQSPTAIADVQRAAGGDLRHILDCVGEGVSPQFCYKAMGPSGGKYSTFLFPKEGNRKDIQASMVMAYNAYGSHFHKFGMDFPADVNTYLFASMFCEFTEGLLAQGRLKPHPVTVGEGGWEAISAGLGKLRSGTVSGTKLVFKI